MAEETTEIETPKGPGLMGLVKAIAIVGVLVVVQLVAASMLIPTAKETEQLARDLSIAAKGEEFIEEIDLDENPIDQDKETIEVQLHRANITRFDPNVDKTLNVDFSVYAVVLASELDDFNAEYEKNKSRIHEQIVMTMHGAKTSDLSSAGLGLIKRQILEKTNRALGRPFVIEVVFTKINFVER